MEAIIIASITAVASISTTAITLITNKKVEKIKELKYDFDKTYLTDYLTDIENSVPKSEIQSKIAHEKYDEYVKLGGNSYIHEHWDKLKVKGLL